MANKSANSFGIMFGVVLHSLLFPGLSSAQPPLAIDLQLNRHTYLLKALPHIGMSQDPIQVQLTIQNPGKALLSDAGFGKLKTSNVPIELHLLIRNSAGRLITAKQLAPVAEGGPPPTLPINGRMVPIAQVETILPGKVVNLTIPDLRHFYDLLQPDQYTIQAHIPFRTFSNVSANDSQRKAFAKLADIEFRGVLTSNLLTFALIADSDADGYAFPVSDPRLPTAPAIDCHDHDRNINPSEQEILGDGLNNDCDITTLDSMEVLTAFDVTKVYVKQKLKPNHDMFQIEGSFAVDAGPQSIRVSSEEVKVQLGSFIETIPGRAFRQKGKDFVYDGSRQGGIKELKLSSSGRYKIKAMKVDLSRLNLTQPVPFLLRIGDVVGEKDVLIKNGG